MGWLYSHYTRMDLVHALTRSTHNNSIMHQTLRYTLRGNVLWSVVEITALHDTPERPAGHVTTLICCDILHCSDGMWGHKPLTEADGPCYYTCPLRYLAMVPVRSPDWRERVVAYHQGRRAHA